MSKSLQKIEAIRLREKGVSVREISKILNIAKSTVSLWTRDVILTIDQLELLRLSSIKGAERGRLISALLQKKKRLDTIENYNRLGLIEIKKLNDRELMLAGLTLYW